MYKYSKIETLFKRDGNFKITNQIRLPEFENIKRWLITEKIDGTNIRIIYTPEEKLLIRGRTDKASIPTFLLEELQNIFTVDKIKAILNNPIKQGLCLYGEGYGAKIQKGGGNYNQYNSFRLFDVWIDGWWLEWEGIEETAKELGIKTVPTFPVDVLEGTDIETAIALVKNECLSQVATEEGIFGHKAEGIVARAYPTMLFRRGNPIKWKLKVKDYK